MPNNFRLTGNYYVSKAGNDANAGTSPDAPKRTIQAALTAASAGQTIIVGAGVYNDNISKSGGAEGSYTFYADGEVILSSPNLTTNTITFTAGLFDSKSLIMYNFTIVRYNITTTQDDSFPIARFYNCKFIDCTFTYAEGFGYGSGEILYQNCIIINCNVTTIPANTIDLINNVIINSNLYFRPGTNRNNYYDKTSNVSIISSTANSTYNNIQGYVTCLFTSSVTSGVIQDKFGRYYDLSTASFSGDGTVGFPYGRPYTSTKPFDFTNHRIAYPTLNVSSSNVDPKFNSIEDLDFTLQSNSYHIGRASDGINNIGGTKYALRRTAKISFSGSQATVDPSLIFQYDNYVISGSQVTGSVTSAPIAVNTSVPKVIQKVTYNGLLAFNKDTGSASGSNQNVPDFDTFTSASGNAAANPDRLVYYMRHTTGSSIPVSDAGWDNGGLWTAGQYNVFEWNTKPSIDNLGVGNGSGSFNAAVSPTYIQATYVQMKVKLRNDYLL